MDPNYLVDEQLQYSPFHQSLHKYVKNNLKEGAEVTDKGIVKSNEQVRPMLHVDFHGKYPKKDPNMKNKMTDIDIGHMSMKYYWSLDG